MGNTCTHKGQSDAPVMDDDEDDPRKVPGQPKGGGKQIRVVLVDSDCTDSEVDEAVKRILKGVRSPLGGKNTSSTCESSSCSGSSAASSDAAPSFPENEVAPPPQLIAKGVPPKLKKLKMVKKSRKGKLGKQSRKLNSGKTTSKKGFQSATPLSSLASSAESSDSSSSSAVQPSTVIKQPARVTREIIKSTFKTNNTDSTFFSCPLRLPSDSDNSSTGEDSSIAEGKKEAKSGDKTNKKNYLQSSDDDSSADGGGTQPN